MAQQEQKLEAGARTGRATSIGWSLLLVLAAVLVALPSLTSQRIDDVDAAHHLLDGMFFRDAAADLPRSVLKPVGYTLTYYRQYPALGFVYWPPLFPAVEGLFFLVTGSLDVQVGRWCVLAFAIMMMLAWSQVLRRWMSPAASAVTVLVLAVTPLVAAYQQQVMLEVPTLAMLGLTVLCYLRVVERESSGFLKVRDLVLLAGVAAGTVYTKQTAVFLFPALLLDVAVNHRRLLGQRRMWLTALGVVLLLAPLAALTLTVGKANIEQSVGSDKSFVLNSKAPPDRWSADGWLFYAKRLGNLLHVVPLVLGVIGLLYGLARPDFLRRNAIWFGWIGGWYLLFSYFLNKQDRYAIFWLPAWVVLGGILLWEVLPARPWRTIAFSGLLLIPVASGAWGIPGIVIDGFDGVNEMMARVKQASAGRNVLFFGEHHQVIVPFVRAQDSSRRTFVLKGDDILAVSQNLRGACEAFRVGALVLDGNKGEDAVPGLRAMLEDGGLKRSGTAEVRTGRGAIKYQIFVYDGPVAAVEAVVPIGRGKIGSGLKF